jgi:hypothetical protein
LPLLGALHLVPLLGWGIATNSAVVGLFIGAAIGSVPDPFVLFASLALGAGIPRFSVLVPALLIAALVIAFAVRATNPIAGMDPVGTLFDFARASAILTIGCIVRLVRYAVDSRSE